MPIISNFPTGGGSGGGLALAAVTGIATLAAAGKVYVKWTDPDDMVVAGSTLAAWGGTLLVRKAGSAPTSRRDGTIVLDSKTRDQYKSAYQAQWMQENKPHGFDVQDIRLGGLMQRVKTCRARLEDYCAGRLDRLEELEAAQLDFFDHGKRCAEPVATHWGQIATANIVYMTMLW